MTAAAKTAPKILTTGTENVFYVQSSNFYDWHLVVITAPGCAVCSCKAGSFGRACYHRAEVLRLHAYAEANAAARWEALEAGLAEWQRTLEAAETENEIEAVREMNAAA